MPTFVIALFALICFFLGAAAFLGGLLLWVYSEKRSFREPQTIICPDNLDYATVTVDGEYAAETALEGKECFRIGTCSRWPEMRDCDQDCADEAPLVGDDRTQGHYIAFGMTPDQLRSETPVKITPEMYGKVMRQKLIRHLNKERQIRATS